MEKLVFQKNMIVAFEGLDCTGKTTQAERLIKSSLSLQQVHMPSGYHVWTKEVYEIMERHRVGMEAMARQLLHLACHVQAQGEMQQRRKGGALLLDRCWWSTVAYGWHGTGVRQTFDFDEWVNLVRRIWRANQPNVVFMFLHTHGTDSFNRGTVRQGYEDLFKAQNPTAVRVPMGTPDEQEAFITDFLLTNQIAHRATA